MSDGFSSGGDYRIVSRSTDEWADIIVRDDRLVEVHLCPRGYSRANVDQIIGKIKEMQSATQLLVLILADKKSSINLGGIRGLFSRRSLSYSVAKAYVIQKPVHFLLSKICLALFQPKTPIRFFKDRREAESYLKGFVGYGL
jgi:hypothetical protein